MVSLENKERHQLTLFMLGLCNVARPMLNLEQPTASLGTIKMDMLSQTANSVEPCLTAGLCTLKVGLAIYLRQIISIKASSIQKVHKRHGTESHKVQQFIVVGSLVTLINLPKIKMFSLLNPTDIDRRRSTGQCK